MATAQTGVLDPIIPQLDQCFQVMIGSDGTDPDSMALASGVPVIRFVHRDGTDNREPEGADRPQYKSQRFSRNRGLDDVRVCTGNGNAFNNFWTNNQNPQPKPVFVGVSLTGISDTKTAFQNPDAAARVSVQRHGVATLYHTSTPKERQETKYGDIIGIQREDTFPEFSTNGVRDLNLAAPIRGYPSTFRSWKLKIIPRWKSVKRFLKNPTYSIPNQGRYQDRTRDEPEDCEEDATGQFLWIGSFVGWGADNRNEMRVSLHTGPDSFGGGCITPRPNTAGAMRPAFEVLRNALRMYRYKQADGVHIHEVHSFQEGEDHAGGIISAGATVIGGDMAESGPATARVQPRALTTNVLAPSPDLREVVEPTKPASKRAKTASTPAPKPSKPRAPKGVGQTH